MKDESIGVITLQRVFRTFRYKNNGKIYICIKIIVSEKTVWSDILDVQEACHLVSVMIYSSSVK